MSKKFKIQCYGDSLTAGLTEYEFHPYSISLQEELIKLGVNAEVLSTGLSGWTSDQLAESIHSPSYGLASILNTQQFDLVISLAGTNDLGGGNRIPSAHQKSREMRY